MHRLIPLLLTCLLAGSAAATTLLPLSPQQIRERSTLVVLATIDHERTAWSDEAGLPRTDLVLRDVHRLAGQGELPTELTYTGGQWGDEEFRIVGMPAWPLGEPLVLFIEADGRRFACPTVGWSRGILRQEPLTGRLLDGLGDPIALSPGGDLRSAQPDEPGLDLADLVAHLSSGASR